MSKKGHTFFDISGWQLCWNDNLPHSILYYLFPLNYKKTKVTLPKKIVKDLGRFPTKVQVGHGTVTEMQSRKYEKDILEIDAPGSPSTPFQILKKDVVDQKYALVYNKTEKSVFPVLKDDFEENYFLTPPAQEGAPHAAPESHPDHSGHPKAGHKHPKNPAAKQGKPSA